MSYSPVQIDNIVARCARRVVCANAPCREIQAVCWAMIRIQQSQTVKKKTTMLFHDMVMFAEIADELLLPLDNLPSL